MKLHEFMAKQDFDGELVFDGVSYEDHCSFVFNRTIVGKLAFDTFGTILNSDVVRVDDEKHIVAVVNNEPESVHPAEVNRFLLAVSGAISVKDYEAMFPDFNSVRVHIGGQLALSNDDADADTIEKYADEADASFILLGSRKDGNNGEYSSTLAMAGTHPNLLVTMASVLDGDNSEMGMLIGEAMSVIALNSDESSKLGHSLVHGILRTMMVHDSFGEAGNNLLKLCDAINQAFGAEECDSLSMVKMAKGWIEDGIG